MTGLISYWKLDEASGTRVDAHGTNHLTDNNTVGQATGIAGSAGQFIRANSEYLSVAHNPTLSLSNTSFTISLWAYFDSLTDYRMLASKYRDVPPREFYIEYAPNVSRLRFWMNYSSVIAANALGAPSAGTWYFLVCWFDMTAGTMNIQINNGGINTLNGASAADADAQATPFLLGARNDNGVHDHMDGRLDEVGLWRRVLTAGERTELFSSGVGLPYPFP
jgi:hypothetical protein